MTPFAEFLFQLRRTRGLRQKELADLLGVDSSYLSALEGGRRDPPASGRLEHFARILGLSQDQTGEMLRSAAMSGRRIDIPDDASREEYILAHEFATELGSFSGAQIELMRTFLRIKRDEIGIRHQAKAA